MKRTPWISALLGVAVLFLGTASQAQSYKFPYLEAECPSAATGAYLSVATNQAGYSGGGHLTSNGNTTAGSYNNTSTDTATYNFQLDGKRPYTVYFRVRTGGNADDDSFFYNMDGPGWVTVNNIASQGSGWIWIASPSVLMSGGMRTVKIANRENGIAIDKIAILDSALPPPTGSGEPAYNCPTPVYFEAECRTEAIEGYGARYQVKTGFSGSGYLQSEHNTTSTSGIQDRVKYTFQTGGSRYSLYVRAHTNGSGNDDSFYYRVDGGQWQTVNGLYNLGSNWGWALAFSNLNLSQGDHNIEIGNREDGFSLDKLALIPNGSSAPSGQGPVGVNCFGDSDDWRITDVYDYANGHADYFFYEGSMILNRHVLWHTRADGFGNPINGAGGMTGPGSGIAFLGFHRAMLNRIEKYALSTGGLKWEAVAVDAPLPYELPDSNMALFAAGYISVYLPQVSRDLSQVGVPAFLTLDGTPHPSWPINGESLDNKSYATIGDIESLDTLGRLIGGAGIAAMRTGMYHARVHSIIDGTMSSFYSPADPAFYLWHGKLDQLVDLWLSTPKGQAWMAAHPGHPFLQAGFTDLDAWETDYWVNHL